jgi:peptidoglycan LD-endopeptidase LytH
MLIALAALAPVAALVWWQSRNHQVRYEVETRPTPATVSNISDLSPVLSTGQPDISTSLPPSTLPPTSPVPLSSSPLAPTTPSASPANISTEDVLLVPVPGVRPEDLRDTYTESRSGGRSHDAIDIIAPRGTPVLAAADGRIVKLFQSVPGGITIYQLANDNRTIFYYAHLERYADGLHEGQTVRRGEVIAYVGDTGNATPGNYHLHFSVSIVSDPRRWWSGTNVNPYPLFFPR